MEIAAGGNIFIRPNRLDKAGDKTTGHTHNFDHVTIVFTGAIHVRAFRRAQIVKEVGPDDGLGAEISTPEYHDTLIAERDFHAPAHCLIRADVMHEITALEDNTVYWCCYAHRTPQGDVVQHETGWTDAYV